MLHFLLRGTSLNIPVPAEIQIFRTPFGVPVLCGQRLQFRLAAPMQWINLEFWLVSLKYHPPSHPLLLYLRVSLMCEAVLCGGHGGRPTVFELSTTCKACTLLTASPYTSVNLRWISVGEVYFAHKSRIALRTYSRDQYSIIVAIACQLIPLIASDRVTLELCVACYLYYEWYLVLKNKALDWYMIWYDIFNCNWVYTRWQ